MTHNLEQAEGVHVHKWCHVTTVCNGETVYSVVFSLQDAATAHRRDVAACLPLVWPFLYMYLCIIAAG